VRSLLPIYSVEYIAGCTNVARATKLYTKHTWLLSRLAQTYICIYMLAVSVRDV
jgi:hypothetical protein